jgi:hypothetical protein
MWNSLTRHCCRFLTAVSLLLETAKFGVIVTNMNFRKLVLIITPVVVLGKLWVSYHLLFTFKEGVFGYAFLSAAILSILLWFSAFYKVGAFKDKK